MINITPTDLLFTINEQIKTSKIYISIDKDVLSFNDAVTNWDQGHVKLEYIIETIKLLKKNFNYVLILFLYMHKIYQNRNILCSLSDF